MIDGLISLVAHTELNTAQAFACVVLLSLIDVISGVCRHIVKGDFRSRTLRAALPRKLLNLCMLSACCVVDKFLSTNAIFTFCTIYLSMMELLSIAENTKLLDVVKKFIGGIGNGSK